MAVYNSSPGVYEDDSDITIINPSIGHEPIDDNATRPQVTNIPTDTIPEQPNSSSKYDYIIVDHQPQENAKQLEEILKSYIRDLKHEANTQVYCDQQLIIRLMDMIRLAYPNDQKKMIELDEVMKEIASLHDKRFVENEEKIQQLHTEICQLNKRIVTTSMESPMINENTKFVSMPTMSYENQSIDNDQWIEIDKDSKQLHDIIQSQIKQINEIIALISEAVTSSTDPKPSDASIDTASDTTHHKDKQTILYVNTLQSLVRKIQNMTRQNSQQEPATTATSTNPPLENPSPGTSPSNSLATLVAGSLPSTIPPIETPTKESEQNTNVAVKESGNKPYTPDEEPHPSVGIPSTPTPAKEKQICPICNHEFASTLTDANIYDHVEKCLFPSGMNTQPKDYECPNCNRKFANSDEGIYLQHLSDCYNRDV